MEEDRRGVGAGTDGGGTTVLDGLPSAIRAVAEISYSEIKVYYDASVEYGRNTVPEAGLFYIGAARAQWEFVRFCAALKHAEAGKPVNPAISPTNWISWKTSCFPSTNRLPPSTSIPVHPGKRNAEAGARAAKRRDAARRPVPAAASTPRFTGSMATGVSVDSAEASRRADETEKQLAQIPGDHSLARLYLEMARSESALPEPAGGETARAVFDFVIPHYFAAIQPAVQRPRRPRRRSP